MSFRSLNSARNRETNLNYKKHNTINSVKAIIHPSTVFLNKKNKFKYLLYDAPIYNIDSVNLNYNTSRNFNTINDETKITSLNKENSISPHQKTSHNFSHDKINKSLKKIPKQNSMKYIKSEENSLAFDKKNKNEHLKSNSIKNNNINNYYILNDDNIFRNENELNKRGFAKKLNIDIDNLLLNHKRKCHTKSSKSIACINQRNKKDTFNLYIKNSQCLNKYNENNKIEFSKTYRDFQNTNNIPFMV